MIWNVKHTMLHMLNQPNGYAVRNMRERGLGANAENLRQMFPNNAKTTTIAGYFSANVSEALQFCSAEVASEALHHCFAGADSC